MTTRRKITLAEARQIALRALAEAEARRAELAQQEADAAVPLDYEPPLVADGTVIAIVKRGELPPVAWDY